MREAIPRLLATLDQALGIRNRWHGFPPGGFDLEGEKLLDWSWIVSNLEPNRGKRLIDIGCAQAPIVPTASALGYTVYGVDTDSLCYCLPGFEFYHDDYMDVVLPSGLFDVVVLCSVVEHIGLPGRYDQKEIPDGDLQAMKKAKGLLRPDGMLLLTIPVGSDLIFTPWHRIYGPQRLPSLLGGFSIRKEQFWTKQPGGPWQLAVREAAMSVDRAGLSYALGQFALRPQSVR
ncbi:DUF268 domain-containing protein [Chloroflexota bacterium]